MNLNHLFVSVLVHSSVERVCSTRVAISGRTVSLPELTLHITVHDGRLYTHLCLLVFHRQDRSEEGGRGVPNALAWQLVNEHRCPATQLKCQQ